MSRSESAEFRFHDGSPGLATIDLRIPVTRREFESWIEDDLQAIEVRLTGFSKFLTIHAPVDCVFLTGGSSFVPAVRRIFETRFGQIDSRRQRVTSVAHGLALRAV